MADTSCDVSVLPLVLPDGSLGPDYHRTFYDVRAAGLNDPDRKYLLFSEELDLWVGELYWDPSPAANLNDGHSGEGMISRTPGVLVQPTFHSTAAHELIHNLGGAALRAQPQRVQPLHRRGRPHVLRRRRLRPRGHAPCALPTRSSWTVARMTTSTPPRRRAPSSP